VRGSADANPANRLPDLILKHLFTRKRRARSRAAFAATPLISQSA